MNHFDAERDSILLSSSGLLWKCLESGESISERASATAIFASNGCTFPSETDEANSPELEKLEGVPYFGSGVTTISPLLGMITCSTISKMAED